MGSRRITQCAAAMRVTRVANTSSDTKVTAAGHQISFNPPADSLFRSRSYVTFVTDQELQQARADMEECFRRRARRAGLEESLPVGRPMTDEEIETCSGSSGTSGLPAGTEAGGRNVARR